MAYQLPYCSSGYALFLPNLFLIFHQLFSVSYVPSEWKQAVIVPVRKKGLSTCTANYKYTYR